MNKELIEVLSSESNNDICKHPKRSYPGLLIQGDSLSILLQDIREANNELSKGNTQESSEILKHIIENLEDRLEHYKKVLKEHGYDLPFVE